jgi:uncharacterized membrane protein
MNLIQFLYQPYIIILFISLLITISVYFYIKYSKVEQEEYDGKQKNNLDDAKTMLIAFVVSFILMMGAYFGVVYAGKYHLFERVKVDASGGGGFENSFMDRLTVVSEDVDFDLMDE